MQLGCTGAVGVGIVRGGESQEADHWPMFDLLTEIGLNNWDTRTETLAFRNVQLNNELADASIESGRR